VDEWLVLVNPYAGRSRHAEHRAREALRHHDIDAKVRVPQTPAEMRQAVDEGVREGRSRFVSVGGDGTANLVADRLLAHQWEQPPVLGLLPSGSGSDLARSFGIPQDMRDAAAALRGEDWSAIDVGILEGTWGQRRFINVGEAGLTAAVLYRSLSLPRSLGSLKYHLALALVYPRIQLFEMTLEAAGEVVKGSSLLAVFANARYFAGGWKIAPEASSSDGLFDIQVFTASKRDVPRLWWLAKNGNHVGEPAVHRLAAASFTLDVEGTCPVQADGEYFGEGSLRGHMLRDALRIKTNPT
jgi:diacylglycerol kinase (ATP)